MRKSILSLVAVLIMGTASAASHAAVTSVVSGGQTSVLFGNGALASVGLAIAGVGGDIIVPGSLGPMSVAFPIVMSTTFSYDADDFLGTFAGTVEHSGSVTLTDLATNTASVTVGNFTIGFDGSRVGGDASGFFVQDNLDTGAILFDIGSPLVEAFDTSLVVTGNLLISPEFSELLNTLTLVSFDVTGADAGLALVVADANPVPLPAGIWLLGSALGAVLVRRRTA